jgi:septal ring factor EnvC (AmiA/AmiB activator)
VYRFFADRPTRLACVVFVCLAAFALACPILAQDSDQEEIDKKKNELEQLRKELAAKRAKAKELEGAEKGVQAQINELDSNLALTEKYIRKLEEREKQVQNELADLEVQLTDASGTLDQRKALMGKRLRAMYKYGRYRSLAAIVSSSSFADVMSHVRFLHLVAKRDKQIMAAIHNYQAEVRSTQIELENNQAEIARIQSEKESEKKNLASTKKKRQAAIASIRGEKEAHLAAARELEETAAAIQKLIETLEAARRASKEVPQWASDLAGAKGSVPWPVSGEVVTKFGTSVNPRFGTRTYSNGIDIKAPIGTPIRCVADGKVEFIDYLAGYDRCIIINHGRGYYTLYAHATAVRVSVGQEVKGGDPIAAVGEGSSVKGTVLHFEIRKGQEAQNPLNWLVSR